MDKIFIRKTTWALNSLNNRVEGQFLYVTLCLSKVNICAQLFYPLPTHPTHTNSQHEVMTWTQVKQQGPNSVNNGGSVVVFVLDTLFY